MINWENLYNKIIKDKISLNGEKHHVIPKHDGGKDSDGIVILERRYHILAHYIRWRWKKQLGDKISYQMMRGQVINPMLDPETKKYIMGIINSMINNPEYIEYRKNKQKELWNNNEYREKTIRGRKEWIKKGNNRYKLAERINTKDARDKANKSLKKYYDTINTDVLKYRAKKIKETINKKYSKKEVSSWSSQVGEKNGMFGKGHLISGEKSGKWNGYKYIVEKQTGETEEFLGISNICYKMKISSVTVNNYVNTNKQLVRGNLKGCKIFSVKIK
jgi:hypothetical protein